MGHFLDESGRQKLLYLLVDVPVLFLVESARRCFTGLEPTWMSKACSKTSLGMPSMSEGLHANISAFARRKSMSTASYLLSRVALTLSARSLQ